jgi:hypothetical protein
MSETAPTPEIAAQIARSRTRVADAWFAAARRGVTTRLGKRIDTLDAEARRLGAIRLQAIQAQADAQVTGRLAEANDRIEQARHALLTAVQLLERAARGE